MLIRYVRKRDGRTEPISFDKITARIANLARGLMVDPTVVAQKCIEGVYNNIRTTELDSISADVANSLVLQHPDYATLAVRIAVSNMHKSTPAKFSLCVNKIYSTTGLFHKEQYEWVMENAAALDAMIVDSRDGTYSFRGLRKLVAGYLDKVQDIVTDADNYPIYLWQNNPIPREKIQFINGSPQYLIEGDVPVTLTVKTVNVMCDRPQYLLMRVAIAVTWNETNRIERVAIVYDEMSRQLYTHATPTLFNACKPHAQLMSCCLLGCDDDIESIMETIKNCAFLSKRACGIGMHSHSIRPAGSLIKGTGGKSSGLPRQLRIYNETACTFDQGGKRPGSIAVYLEQWHGDILKFLEMKLPSGSEADGGARARDLFYALWTSDLFVKLLEEKKHIALFGSDRAPGLAEVYDGMQVCQYCDYCSNHAYARYFRGQEFAPSGEPHQEGYPAEPNTMQAKCGHKYERKRVFTELYTRYVNEGCAIGAIPCEVIMKKYCTAVQESGTPYACFKDHVNRMNNQGWLTIKSSNLCTEIVEWSSASSYASCCLASINLQRFLVPHLVDGRSTFTYDFEALAATVASVVRNLDNVIDVNEFPAKECVWNSRALRPIGIGIQGLANVFQRMRILYLSDQAEQLDMQIMETIYVSAIKASAELARERGVHFGFEHTPASKGVLAYDLWLDNHQFCNSPLKDQQRFTHDCAALREIAKGGLRHSLMIAPMPTASTAEILGNNEAFEPFHNNIFTHTTGNYKSQVVNRHMVEHLVELGLWNQELRNEIILAEGSVQKIASIPLEVRQIYLTVYEMSQKSLMRRTALRQMFVDQSLSHNIFLAKISEQMIRAVFTYAHQYCMKTTYYIRSDPARQALKVGVNETFTQKAVEPKVCLMEPGCDTCSS